MKATCREPTTPSLAPYHRTIEEIETMPVIEKTMTVCPECKLIINGTIYKDGDNVMIRKNCPEHEWTIEKYWEDYDMYMKMRRYNYYGRGFDNPNYITETKGANCPFDCGMCERHKSHTGLANVVITNRCHLSMLVLLLLCKGGRADIRAKPGRDKEDIQESEEPEANPRKRDPDNRRRADDAPSA